MGSEETTKTNRPPPLGGGDELPSYLNIMRFAEARAQEVKKMINLLTEINGSKLIFQKLPKHMRRRVMSHNAKRLPHKLRESHLNQLKKSGMPVKTKRPSRKFRRKPSNLLAEYNRRKKRHAWLETHIWHAKRYHMIEKWGFKLPQKSCDKTFRTCYRASAKYCLLQDISYYSCMEINGNQSVLSDGFKHMTNQNTGLTVSARAFLNSQREGSAIFYNKNCYPFNAIGEVKFIWKPSSNSERTLWLWMHPTLYDEVLKNVLELFNLKVLDKDVPETYSNINSNIVLRVLKNHFNRFRLTGPLSNAVIQRAFKPPTSTNKTKWFDNYLNSDENRQIFSDQCEFWEKLRNMQSPSELSPHIIVNLITTDPRYNFPRKRTKALPDIKNLNEVIDINPSLKYGEIWEHSTRKFVSENKISTSQFLKERASLIVSEDVVPATATAFPIMLIQRPGVKDGLNYLGKIK